MTIQFNSISSTQREPVFAVEFDSSKAQQGPTLLAYKALIIGQKLVGGTATADQVVKATSVDQVITLAGRGSMLHRQAIAWFANNKVTELWLGVLSDNGAGVAAQGTITVTGPATATGTIALYLGGVRITVGVNNGDAQNAIATAIVAAITSAADLPITAAAVANVVTWTYRHKGEAGQGYDVRHSFLDGEALPAGVAIAIAATTAGTTNPVLTNLIAAMADMWFQIWTQPYTDATSLTALETELADRWGPARQMDGVSITSKAGSFSTLTTLGSGRNSKHTVIQGQPSANPLTPPMEMAAATAAQVALSASIDPARPFQTLIVNGVMAPSQVDLFSDTERNLLLFDGISTSKVGAGQVVQLGRVITTYQLSPAGADDTAYLDVTTPLTLAYLRYDFRTRMQIKYPRHKLGNSGVQYGAGQLVITPDDGKAEAVTWFEDMQKLGLVEGGDDALALFQQNLVVERDLGDPNRMNWLLPPDLMNQFIVGAAQIQFRL